MDFFRAGARRRRDEPGEGPRFTMGLYLLAFCLLSACMRRSQVVAIAGPDGTVRVTLQVEIADTSSKRELGLMYRKWLDPEAAMLFVFPSAEPLQFWMKNTAIPLDVIFADARGEVIGVREDARPYSEALLPSPGPSKFVVEVNGGAARRWGIRTGDRLRFIGFTPRASL
jgi:uncharacterized membrane protein (UPF0127 family)